MTVREQGKIKTSPVKRIHRANNTLRDVVRITGDDDTRQTNHGTILLQSSRRV